MIQLNVDMFISPGLFRVIRVLRIGRLLRFFEAARGIRQLIFALLKSAPALSNVGTLLFLIIFIYSVMGMSMFGRLRQQGSINPVVNFETFGSSMCLLFRISTAAGWNGVLDGAMHEREPHCSPTLGFGNGITQGDCGNKIVAIIFFCTYIMLIVLIVVNTYIAVILENFNEAQAQDECGIAEDDIEAYYETWQKYDPKATQFIQYRELADFLDDLEQPFKVEKPNYWFIESMDIPIKDDNEVHCLDILHSLIRHILGEEKCVESEHTREVMKKVDAKYEIVFPKRLKKETIRTISEQFKKEIDAACTIQRVFRWYLCKDHIDLYLANSEKTKLQIYREVRKIQNLLDTMIEAKEKRLERIAEEKRIKELQEQEQKQELKQKLNQEYEDDYGLPDEIKIMETRSL